MSGLALLPPELPWPVALGLVGFSFFTSALTAVLGVGGGVAMLAVMAQVLPPALLIPVHGIVQLGSNTGRAVLMRREVERGLLARFVAGGVVGTALAASLFVALPVTVLQLVLGAFILFAVWVPRFGRWHVPERAFWLVGLVVNFAGMFIGAAGPMVAACLSPERLTRHRVVATQGACVSSHYVLKAVAFGVIGFRYAPWLVFLAAMIGAGFLGTMAGRRLLDRLPERSFALGFRVVLSVLALRLLWAAVAP